MLFAPFHPFLPSSFIALLIERRRTDERGKGTRGGSSLIHFEYFAFCLLLNKVLVFSYLPRRRTSHLVFGMITHTKWFEFQMQHDISFLFFSLLLQLLYSYSYKKKGLGNVQGKKKDDGHFLIDKEFRDCWLLARAQHWTAQHWTQWNDICCCCLPFLDGRRRRLDRRQPKLSLLKSFTAQQPTTKREDVKDKKDQLVSLEKISCSTALQFCAFSSSEFSIFLLNSFPFPFL